MEAPVIRQVERYRLEVFMGRWAEISFGFRELDGPNVQIKCTETRDRSQLMSRDYITPEIIESTVEAFLVSVAGKL